MIYATISDCADGDFHVTGTYTVRINGSGPGVGLNPIFGRAYLRKGGHHGSTINFFESHAGSFFLLAPFNVDVHVTAGKETVIVSYDPVINFDQPTSISSSSGTVRGQISIDTVDKQDSGDKN